MSDKIMNEVYFEWWLDELVRKGFVLEYKREPKTFDVLDSITVTFLKHFKRKSAEWRTKNLTNSLVWTPDYKVLFHKSLINKIVSVIDFKYNENNVFALNDYSENNPGSGLFDNVFQEALFFTTDCHDDVIPSKFDYVPVWFDVKPPAKALQFSGALGSSRDFRFLRTLLFKRYGIFVNKVVPIQLYNKTFMPTRYLFTDSGRQPRKIKKSFKTIEEWIEDRNLT